MLFLCLSYSTLPHTDDSPHLPLPATHLTFNGYTLLCHSLLPHYLRLRLHGMRLTDSGNAAMPALRLAPDQFYHYPPSRHTITIRLSTICCCHSVYILALTRLLPAELLHAVGTHNLGAAIHNTYDAGLLQPSPQLATCRRRHHRRLTPSYTPGLGYHFRRGGAYVPGHAWRICYHREQ